MNIWLQVALGIAPFLIVAIIVMLKRHYYSKTAILTIVTAFTLLVTSSVFAFVTDTSTAQMDNHHSNMYLIGTYLLEGDLQAAETALEHLYESHKYHEQYTLYSARLEYLKGNIEQAKLLYAFAHKAYEETNNHIPEIDQLLQIEEAPLVNGTTSVSDYAVYRYLQAKGEQPEEHHITMPAIKAVENKGNQQELIFRSINKELQQLRDGSPALEELEQQVNLLLNTNDLFTHFIAGQQPEEREIKKIVRRFEELKENNSNVLQLEEFKLARMKALLMDGSIHQLPKMVDDDLSMNELMLLSGLYITNSTRKSVFEAIINPTDQQKYDRVIQQVEKIVDEQYKDESRRVRNQVRDQIAILRKEQQHLPLVEIRNQIQDKLPASPTSEHSKLYLQMSKIDNYLGNEVRADTEINQALATVSYSNDAGYVEPMREIIQIIHNNAESEAIKNVPEYVQKAVEHSLPIPLHPTHDETDSFNQYFTEYVSKKRAQLTIGMIDASNFPEIAARVQISHDITDTITPNALEIYDQKEKISDFTFEKLTFERSRIMLLTDNSGSMDMAISDLKQAVSNFISGMEDNELVSLVTFSSSIKNDTGFINDVNQLNNAVSALNANGGTAIYNSLLYGMEQFPDDMKSNNIIILMTDGMDGSIRSVDTLRKTIGALSLEKGITVHTIGLGPEVDTAYLESIARYGNGSFIYANNAESLQSFYEFIHMQLTNQYQLQYTAQNAIDTKRELTVRYPAAEAQDTKAYTLHFDSAADDEVDTLVQDAQGKVKLFGLNPKLIVQGSNELSRITLHGEGFSTIKNYSLSFAGAMNYIITDTEIVDDGSIQFVLPKNMLPGVYDLELLADSNGYTLEDEFELLATGKAKTLTFGPYTLKASEITKKDAETYLLRGNVRLNNFLRFRGELLLEGNPDQDLSITLTDLSGSTITFDPKNSTGLSKAMAQLGLSLDFPSFGSFKLFRDEKESDDFDDYRVDRIYLKDKSVRLQGIKLDNNAVYVYPDRVVIDFRDINLDLPFQEAILKYKGLSPFAFVAETDAVVTPKNIALVANLKAEKDGGLRTFNIGKLPVNLDTLSADINTLKHDYDLKAQVSLNTLPMVDSIGMQFAVKGGKFDTIMLYADVPIRVVQTPVPVSLEDFGIGIQGMSKVEQGANFKQTLLGSEITGQMDITAGKAADYLPFLKKFLDDFSLIKVDDATVKARVRDFSLQFEADINLLGFITLSTVDIRLGHFEFENYLLNIPSQEVKGIYIGANQELNIDFESIFIDFEGSESITISNVAQGLWASGDINYEVDWWVFHAEQSFKGDLWIGLHNNAGKTQLTFLIKGTDPRKNKQQGVRIVFKDGSILPQVKLY